jgi:hypothetical protein
MRPLLQRRNNTELFWHEVEHAHQTLITTTFGAPRTD